MIYKYMIYGLDSKLTQNINSEFSNFIMFNLL